MLITKTIEIDMGHRVPNHKSKCRNFHGHRYKVEVGVNDKIITTKGASDEGMVIDFSDLKEIMMINVDGLCDHGFMMYEDDKLVKDWIKYQQQGYLKIVFVPFIPTVENIAKYWYNQIEPHLVDKKIKLEHVKVWETPTSTAIYRGEDK